MADFAHVTRKTFLQLNIVWVKKCINNQSFIF